MFALFLLFHHFQSGPSKIDPTKMNGIFSILIFDTSNAIKTKYQRRNIAYTRTGPIALLASCIQLK